MPRSYSSARCVADGGEPVGGSAFGDRRWRRAAGSPDRRTAASARAAAPTSITGISVSASTSDARQRRHDRKREIAEQRRGEPAHEDDRPEHQHRRERAGDQRSGTSSAAGRAASSRPIPASR